MGLHQKMWPSAIQIQPNELNSLRKISGAPQDLGVRGSLTRTDSLAE